MHFDTFHEWFKEQVKELEATSNILKDVKVLARGPSYITKGFSAFDVNNGYRFRTKQSEEFKKFSIPRRGEAYVLKSLGKKWKDYKCDLKGEYLPKYKTKDALLKNRPSRIPRDQWSGLVSYWLSDKAKAVNGVGPTRAQVFLLTHTKCKDGRPLDDDSAKAIEIINERMNNSDSSTDQPPRSVAWEGDVYSQVFGNDKSGSYSLMFDNLAVGRFQNDEKLRKSFEDHHSSGLVI
ncbi:uncharacterized protein LOC107830300 isoform X1 [Nicotiana tabacum]|uniref:Uncharacterized protein LOC107830300 isoform X1 n=1 Tax=Nicotiana tabacum TaxID=4097 RepID=A0A1S4DIU0_TOBAC|nr:PREDICTED: uncharacterized protein LOC107830300 isoform X1 [Nicotiana tabacum]